MDRKNMLIIAAVVFAAALLLVLSGMGRTQVQEDMVIISVDGREYLRVPLSKPQTVTIAQGDGIENVVEITADGAVMHSSTCDNQLCVGMGKVTLGS